MADIKSRKERSKNMAAIKGKDTKPERYICHELFKRGYRYRKNVSYIEGHPDLFLRKYNTAIFIHGCFWHRHKGCKYTYTPKSRTEFWGQKFEANIKRDRDVQTILREKKIKCLLIWECTVKAMVKDSNFNEEIIKKVLTFLNSDELFLEL